MLPGVRHLAVSTVFFLSLLAPDARASQEKPGLTGRVLGSPDQPLAGARVELVPVLPLYAAGRLRIDTGEAPPPVAVTTTGPDGRFQLALPRQGSWKVVVRSPGKAPVQYSPLLWVQPGIELPAILPPRSNPVAISVVDGAGKPVRDAWVLATDAREAEEARRSGIWKIEPRAGRTGPDGTVTLAALEGRPLELHVFPRGGGEEVRRDFTGGVVSLSGPEPRRVTLKIESAGGVPLSSVQGRVGGMNWPAGFADEQGTLRLAVDAKTSRVRLVAPDGRQKVVNLPPDGEPVIRVVLPELRVLTGRVLDQTTGKGLKGVLLSPETDPGAVMTTDEEGRYRLSLPGPGPLALEVRAPGYLPKQLTIPAADLQAGRLPSLSLEKATAIEGSVVDEGLHSLSGVVVEAVPRKVLGSRQLSPREPVVDRTTTDASGRFKLRRLRASESYEIRVLRSGLLTAARIVAVPVGGLGRKPLQIRLYPVRPAQGSVADAKGRPIAGARIVLRPATRPGFPILDPRAEPDLPEGDPARGRSDAQGNFLIAAVPAEEIDFAVTQPGFAPAHRKGIRTVGGNGPVSLGRIILTPGAHLTGRVIDARSRPVPDAEIFLLSSPPRGFEVADSLRGRKPQATSDPEGRFEIADLARGVPQSLVTRADGYLISLLNGVRAPQERPVVVRLQRGAVLTGRVVDEEGKPVEGAHVDLTWLAMLPETPKPRPVGKPVMRSAVTEADGRFEIKDSPEGPVTLDVAAHGFLSLSEVAAEVPWKDPAHELVLVLARGSSLAGQVTTTAGDPVERARVSVKGGAAWTDAEGAYRIDGVREGSQEVKVFQPDYPPLNREVKIEPGENSQNFVLEAGTEVSGRTVDQAGTPVAGARVTLQSTRRFDIRQFEAVSGEDGRFSMHPVTAGEYRIEAEAGEQRSAGREPLKVAKEPVTGLEVVLRSGTVLSGKVLGLSPEELAIVEVQARREQGRTVPAHLQADGRYEARGLEPGDWIVQANLWQGQRQTQARVVIGADDAEVTRDLDFGQGVTLSGRVLLNDDPLPDAVLSVRGQKLARERSVHTDFSGGFRIDDLEPDRYWLGVSHPEKLVTHNQWLDLQTDQEVEIRLEDSSLSGQVLETGSGKPVPGARITLRPSTGPDFMVSAGAEQDGSFHIYRVPASPYRMQVTADGYETFEQEILVASGQELTDFDISLKRAEGLRLQVRRASGDVPQLIHVLALAPDGRPVMADTRRPDGDGWVLLSKLPAGSWTLLIGASQAAMAAQPVTIPGDPVQMTLAGASRFQVRVNDLTTSDVAATLTILDSDKRPLRTLAPGGRLQQSWPLVGGKGMVENVPAGVWSARVESTDGRRWSATLTSIGGGDQTLSIP